jgi:hypothetical protein
MLIFSGAAGHRDERSGVQSGHHDGAVVSKLSLSISYLTLIWKMRSLCVYTFLFYFVTVYLTLSAFGRNKRVHWFYTVYTVVHGPVNRSKLKTRLSPLIGGWRFLSDSEYECEQELEFIVTQTEADEGDWERLMRETETDEGEWDERDWWGRLKETHAGIRSYRKSITTRLSFNISHTICEFHLLRNTINTFINVVICTLHTFSNGNRFLAAQDIPYETGWDLWRNIFAIGIIAIGMEFLGYIQLRRMKKLK